jgi:dTDP-4-dehydrorhamnose 3,5-epimerase
MEFIKTKFKDAWLIKPQVFQDNRGFFLETYSRKKFSETGIEANFVQDNHSLSVKKGVLRGLHFQAPPFAQAKLLRMTKGSVYDAIIDIRKDSSTFGKWEGFTLSAENFSMLFVPKGFLHGFMTLEDNTEFQYKCDNFYEPRSEGGIIWNDPTLNIDWPIKDPILSERDVKWGKFEDFNSPF